MNIFYTKSVLLTIYLSIIFYLPKFFPLYSVPVVLKFCLKYTLKCELANNVEFINLIAEGYVNFKQIENDLQYKNYWK